MQRLFAAVLAVARFVRSTPSLAGGAGHGSVMSVNDCWRSCQPRPRGGRGRSTRLILSGASTPVALSARGDEGQVANTLCAFQTNVAAAQP